MFDRLGRAQFFSKLNCNSGFHQICVCPDVIEKTAFKTKYVHIEFSVVPMGFSNAPATFQALMNSIFRDCIDGFVVIYLDDILILSDSREGHLKHLQVLLSKFRHHKHYVGRKVIDLMRTETEFLGILLGRIGLKIGEGR